MGVVWRQLLQKVHSIAKSLGGANDKITPTQATSQVSNRLSISTLHLVPYQSSYRSVSVCIRRSSRRVCQTATERCQVSASSWEHCGAEFQQFSAYLHIQRIFGTWATHKLTSTPRPKHSDHVCNELAVHDTIICDKSIYIHLPISSPNRNPLFLPPRRVQRLPFL